MAVITKYNEARNPDKNGISYQQSISITGAGTSDELIVPPAGEHGFSFHTDGSGIIEVSMSTAAEIEAGTGTWLNNDIAGGPTLAGDTIGTFKAITGIRINNVSGTSTLRIVTKKE